MTVEGDISDFPNETRHELREKFAEEFDVALHEIELIFSAASVNIEVLFDLEDVSNKRLMSAISLLTGKGKESN